MPTICFVHGVGNKAPGFSKPLSDRVRKATGADVIEHVWDHHAPLPDDDGGFLSGIKTFTAEVILDFLRSIRDYDAHSAALPEADMYVGHSAGSVIICGKDKPKVMMGSPLRLVGEERAKAFGVVSKGVVQTLNLVCRDDVIAFRMGYPEVEDVVFTPSAFNLASRLIPLMAHMSYWDSRRCASEVVRWYRIHFPAAG